MDILILLVVMVVVGLAMGWVAGLIWKENRPFGVQGDYGVAVVTAVLVGLFDWYVIPAMGFSQSLVYLGLALEPALGALLVLWIIRKAKQ
jgi:uncharacterized membrane protein YeaQ/YmgE (transglycosylase-associated protein family)